MQDRVVLERLHGGAVLRAILDAPPGNILDIATLSDLNRRVAAEGGSKALKAIVFEGAGPNFSFGVSIQEHRTDTVEEMLRAFHDLFRTLLRLDRVLVAVVRGRCLGGGLELASFCHRVFAHPRARLGQPEINLGVFPPLASVILPLRCGQAVADEVCLTGRTFSAREALARRLVDEIAADPRRAADRWIAKHLRTAVVSGDVEGHALLGDFPEVEVGDENLFPVEHRARQNRAVRRDDARPSGADQGVGPALDLGRKLQVPGKVAGRGDRARGQDEAAPLEGVMAAGDQIHVANGRPVGDVDLLGRLVHRLPGQRHPVLPADERADPAGGGRDGLQTAPVALTPDQPLGVGRYQLSVAAQDRPVGSDEQIRVVERPVAGAGLHLLVRPDDDHQAILAGGVAQAIGLRAGNDGAVLGQPGVGPLGRRMVPGGRPGAEVEPGGIPGEPRLPEGHQVLGHRLVLDDGAPFMASIVHFEIDRNVHLLESVVCRLLGAALQQEPTVHPGLDAVFDVDPRDAAMANPLIEEPPHVLAQDLPGDALEEVGRPPPVLRGPREKAPQDREEILVPCDAA
ncbi:MAG: hypothetical protein DMF52_03620 [Acidobacteria bacterium]|nr:MAG: hypothetical protein DMF52_03620 [Acidobacteriota bacterium]